MGRIYHLLLLEAKYLGTYYTSVPAATLLLKLALDIDRWPKVNWSDSDELRSFQIGDLACGTGTLLMAASQALTDNFIKWELSKGGSVDASTLRDLQRFDIRWLDYPERRQRAADRLGHIIWRQVRICLSVMRVSESGSASDSDSDSENDSKTAGMHVHVLNRDLLHTLPAMAIERVEQHCESAGELPALFKCSRRK